MNSQSGLLTEVSESSDFDLGSNDRMITNLQEHLQEQELDSTASSVYLQAASSFWKQFNSSDSFLPFYLPFLFWIATYLYSVLYAERKAARKNGDAKEEEEVVPYYKWYALHNFHNFGAIGLGMISLTINDDTKFNERIPILWSNGYFFIDIIDCLSRQDYTYTLHGCFCLVLGLVNYNNPTCRRLRMNSKGSLCELSNPFMHVAKRTRHPAAFALFAVVYTLCRIVWVPILARQLIEADMPVTHPIQVCLLSFYGLNVFWYYKILKILYEGATGKEAAKVD